jgi:nucleotide-binding universal stress UspA family protein
VKEIGPDLLLIGTQGRSGLPRVLLGSVAEEVLRSVEVDILAVPPAR